MKCREIVLPMIAAPLMVVLIASPSAADDRIVAMCMAAEEAMPGRNEGCECALDEVTGEISADEFDLYAEVGAAYFVNMADGLPRAEAWDAAAKSAREARGMSLVDVLQITNPIGQLHQEALEGCQ